MYKKFGKRLIDVILSACGIIVLIPLWIVLAIAIKMDDPGPVFFRQKRITLFIFSQDFNNAVSGTFSAPETFFFVDSDHFFSSISVSLFLQV